MPFPDIPDIPVVRETVYAVDITIAPVDLSPTFVPGFSPAVGAEVAVGGGSVGGDNPAGSLPVYDPPIEEYRQYGETDWTTPAGLPRVFYDGRVDQLRIERTIPLSPSSQSRSTFGAGTIALANVDRALRNLVANYSIDGRNVEIAVGRKSDPRASFTTMFKGLADQWGNSTSTHATIDLRDRWRRLVNDARPLFIGGGGLDGGTELVGKPQPLWLGWRSNVPVVPITSVPFPILMASYRPMESIDYVKVRGKDMTLDGIVTDMFIQTPPAPGHAIVAPMDTTGTALIGLGSEPDGPVTAGGRGLKVGGTYLGKHGAIVNWLWNVLAEIDLSEIDTAALTALDALWDGEVGAWFGTEPANIMSMVDSIMGPINWWGDSILGQLTVGSLDIPSAMDVPGGLLTENEIVSCEMLDWPNGAPWRQVLVAYDTNNFVQTSDVAEATPDWIKYIKEPFQVFPLESVPVRAGRPGAIAPDPIITPYRDANDAAAVAQVLLRMNNGGPNLWQVQTADDRIRYPQGHVLNIRHRSIVDAVRPALVVGTDFVMETRRMTYLMVV